jgi:hypothetical protein
MATLTTPVTPVSTPPISPGVGARRRGPKSLPTLPLSAFSPPNTGFSDSFPLPQSPTTVHPERVVDASVRCSIPDWKEQTNGSALGGRVGAIVVKASESELEGYVYYYSLSPLLGFANLDVIGLNRKLLRRVLPSSPSRFRSAWRAGRPPRSPRPSIRSPSLPLSRARRTQRLLLFERR